MNSLKQQNEAEKEQDGSLAEYYHALTLMAVHHPADLLVFHHGLWGPDTSSDKEALLRASETLVWGCDIDRDWRILDAGCGVGGMAIWLAQEFGCKVTGLTNCEPHVELAAEEAQKRGVGDLVEFVYGDFMEMPFPDAGFDAVLNHETYCHAHNKPAYLRGVHRILKSGGRWQALDGFLTDKALSESDEAIHADLQQGWLTMPLARWRQVLADLEDAGFEDIGEQDLDAEVAPATVRLCNTWAFFWPTFVPPGKMWAYEKFGDGLMSYQKGLQQGVFTYRLIYGVKP